MIETYQKRLFDVQKKVECENCDVDIHRWDETPQGRKMCPNCKTIREGEQRKAIHRKRGELP